MIKLLFINKLNINQKIISFLISQTLRIYLYNFTHYNSPILIFSTIIRAIFNYSSIIVNVQLDTLCAELTFGGIGVKIVITFYSKNEFLHPSSHFSTITGNSFHLH